MYKCYLAKVLELSRHAPWNFHVQLRPLEEPFCTQHVHLDDLLLQSRCRAGFAAHFTSLPKMFLTPAFVAGFTRVLMRHKPGMLKTPVFFTSFEAISTKVLSNSELAFCFKPCSSASFLVIWPLVITLTLLAFIDFIGGSM